MDKNIKVDFTYGEKPFDKIIKELISVKVSLYRNELEKERHKGYREQEAFIKAEEQDIGEKEL